MNNIPDLSIFITRNVKNENDIYLWIECLKQIRFFYKYEPIFIIDDCNDTNLIVNINDIKNFSTLNVHILSTDEDKDIKGSGEFASFYYFYKLKVSKKALFIRDNFFLLKNIDNDIIDNCDIRFLFGFIDNHETYKSLVNNITLSLNEGNNILDYKYKYNWIGCYGVSCLISLDYLIYLNKRYNFFIISNDINNKIMREVFERLFGLLITYDKKSFNNITLYGHNITYNNDLNYYAENKDNLINNNVPFFNYHPN
jgi:hypothetical protein